MKPIIKVSEDRFIEMCLERKLGYPGLTIISIYDDGGLAYCHAEEDPDKMVTHGDNYGNHTKSHREWLEKCPRAVCSIWLQPTSGKN